MKFCYFDESGMGEEPYLVIAGIIVDATRMHVTKDAWANFLGYLSKAAGRRIEEFHSREFYRGNGVWHGTDGANRARIIEAVFNWVENRKHKCVFSGIDKEEYEKKFARDERLKQFKSKWCAAAMHCTLQVQKQHQREAKTKGHSVLIFDREVSEETDFSLLIHKSPQWIDTFYGREKKQTALNQVVDVPFFADSKHILLAQVADLFAYILRTWAEIKDGLLKEKYKDEGDKMRDWSERIAPIAHPRSSRYLVRGRCKAAQLFWDLAPSSLRQL
ncbi:MAG: DUF3800 domain-containing protein [Syntrophales bacterium]|jgi:hypothetical protein|nr:DUF3800 domain-containing protein [Syntrophales bacterium]MCK9527198.1 DUF3800 domain-containing protein [Syntrophales bacterium]MDX9921677.1 DUF3800 domain-containing protein [Syntrophales bacterium]